MMNIEVLTPRKIELKEEADCVVLPTLAGEIAILPNHASLISVLKPGKIRIKNRDKENLFEIEGGVAEVSENSVVILLKRFYNA